MLHAGGGRRLGRPLLFTFHCDAEVEFDEQLLTAVLKGRFIAPRGKLTLAVTWNSESVVRDLESTPSWQMFTLFVGVSSLGMVAGTFFLIARSTAAPANKIPATKFMIM